MPNPTPQPLHPEQAAANAACLGSVFDAPINRAGDTLRPVGELLMRYAKGVVIPDAQIPHLLDVATRGVAYGPTDRHEFVEARLCHRNSLIRYATEPGLTLVTGFAYMNALNLWVSHTWLLDEAGNVIETTEPRDLYVGVPLTRAEADAWVEAWMA